MLHLLQHSTAQPVACDLCVYLCETGRVLCCLSVLADTHHMELFTPSTLRPAGHTRTLCTVSVSLSHFVCFHFLQLTLNHFLLFRLSTRCSLPVFSPSLSFVVVFVCAFSLLCVPNRSLFSGGEAVFDWKQVAGRANVCVCYQFYLPETGERSARTTSACCSRLLSLQLACCFCSSLLFPYRLPLMFIYCIQRWHCCRFKATLCNFLLIENKTLENRKYCFCLKHFVRITLRLIVNFTGVKFLADIIF